MNWVSAKKLSDIKLNGITIEGDYRDKSLASLTLTDATGQKLHVVLENYCVRAMIPAQPEKAPRHVVTGTVPVLGTPVREEFESAFEATERRRVLESEGVIENSDVKLEEIEIPF